MGLLICWFRLSTVMPNYAVACVMAFPVVAVCNVKQGRWLLCGMFFVLLVRHRLRTALVQLGSRNRSGKLPWLVWWYPTPVGERVVLLLVAGMSAAQIEESADALAAACWARQVRVEKSRRMTNFVRVDIIRRDPLESSTPIGSRLMRQLRRVDEPPAVVIPPDSSPMQPWSGFGSGSYGPSTLYRPDGHVAGAPAEDKPPKRPPTRRPGRADDGPDDEGLSEYV